MIRLLWLGIGLSMWQISAIAIDSPVFPNPYAVGIALVESFQSGVLFEAIGASLARVAIGYSMAALLGISLGIFLSLGPKIGRPLQTVLEVLRPIPPIAWVPLAILWFGIGNQAAWFIVFIGAFFPIFIQVYVAFLRPPTHFMELAIQYRLPSSDVFWSIRLPSAAQEICQALRVGLGLAWTSVIAAELVGVRSGLGDRIGQLRYALDYEGVIGCMLCIGVLGWLMAVLALKLEQRFIPWIRYTSED